MNLTENGVMSHEINKLRQIKDRIEEDRDIVLDRKTKRKEVYLELVGEETPYLLQAIDERIETLEQELEDLEGSDDLSIK